MKIAIPWPARSQSQARVRDALILWEDKTIPLVCLVEPCADPFLIQFSATILSRNSTDIGTKVPKCYIYDMVKIVRHMFPKEDWYGFGNSDCVPKGDITEDHTDYEALIYHRTDVPQWKHIDNRLDHISEELIKEIWELRRQGMNDKRITAALNRSGTPPPPNQPEWTSRNIQKLFIDQGCVFFWGQDMYLFRNDVLDRILEGHLKEKDYILGTGGFDPRLSRYLLENFRTARVIGKLFHQSHGSEWRIKDPDYLHNGGDIEISERWEHREKEFLTKLCEMGQKNVIPRFIKYLAKKEDPQLATYLFD